MPWADTLAIVLPFFVSVSLVSLAIFVFVTARHRSHNLAFSALYLLSGLKSLAEALFLHPAGGSRNLATLLNERATAFPSDIVWQEISVVCGFLMPAVLVIFVLLFPVPSPILRRFPATLLLVSAPPIAFLTLWYADALGLPDVSLQRIADASVAYIAFYLVTSVLLLRRAYVRSSLGQERSRVGYVLSVIVAYAIISLPLLALQYLIPFVPQAQALLVFLFTYMAPIVEAGVAFLVAYAIVRYQALGVEYKLKKGAKYVAASGSSVSIFFLTSNTLEELFAPIFDFTSLGYLLAAFLASLIFFPIQTGVGRLMNRIMPTPADETDYAKRRGYEIYRAQAAYVMSDVKVTERERRFLGNLATQLGLSPEEAGRIEEEVERSIGQDVRGGPAALVGSPRQAAVQPHVAGLDPLSDQGPQRRKVRR